MSTRRIITSGISLASIQADFRGLRKLKIAAGKRFTCGVILYDGESGVSFGDNLYAVLIRTLWESK